MAPIIVKGTPERKRNYQREQFNTAVKALAPIIAAIRAEGIVGVEETRCQLNAQGVTAPSGGKFNNRSTHRVLTRLEELNLGPGPRSVSQAMRDRWDRKAEEMKERLNQVIAEQNSRREGRTPDSALTGRSFARGDDNRRDEGIERQ